MELLRTDELNALENLGVNLSATGVTFAHELSETQMRSVGWIVEIVRKRSSMLKDQGTEFVVDDWTTKADEWFGEGTGFRWLKQLQVLREYSDHLLKLMGLTLVQLQSVEYLMNVYCSFLSMKLEGKKKLKTSDLLNSDLRRRTLSMNILRKSLNDTGKFQSSFSSRLESSLGNFVEDRDRFTHHFWLDISREHSDGIVPSIDALQAVDKLVSGVLKESVEVEEIFRGMFYLIGKELAERNNRAEDFHSGAFAGWSKYERQFFAVLRNTNDHD
jgi:hypothetical protein